MPADAELSVENVRYLLDQLDSPDRNPIAAALSKVAAKADDDILLMLSEYAGKFVEWLCDNESEDPLVKAYTACILANIAFLAPGQEKVLEAHGVKPLVKLLKAKDADKKITLHSTAAVQNLTYKNTACCQQVLEEGGESTLKKLLKHKSEDVQQFAAGALANLQLYRKADDNGESSPTGRSTGAGSMMSRRVAKILRRKPNNSTASSSSDSPPPALPAGLRGLQERQDQQEMERAAIVIQSRFQGMIGRKNFEVARKRAAKAEKKGRNKYGGDNIISGAREESEGNSSGGPNWGGLGGRLGGKGLPGIGIGALGGGGSSGAMGSGWGDAMSAIRRPPGGRLAPLPSISSSHSALPPMPASLPVPPPMPMGGPSCGGRNGLGGMPRGPGGMGMPPLAGMR